MSTPFTVPAHGKITADHFTCLTSDVVNADFREDETVKQELSALVARYKDPSALPGAL